MFIERSNFSNTPNNKVEKEKKIGKKVIQNL